MKFELELEVWLWLHMLGTGRPSSLANSSRHGSSLMSIELLGASKQANKSSRLKVMPALV